MTFFYLELEMRKEDTILENDKTGLYCRGSCMELSDCLLGYNSAWNDSMYKKSRFPNLVRPETYKTTSTQSFRWALTRKAEI